ncbi:hypothetical protein IMCC20628_04889 (plasmid) [Hoeflea sp. IMCC20628]|uniref:hypothetical protein n=1 Tax=Hoeflea sp. IMCC20628 TaxID=1620421 RepID=UPI00063AACE8|nr:hypothetical protein [Hoeflea sp. IMCC20628]AKI03553.1 hypothetical protein IMCC20628_04889 [Hoeflea sp. IMCC20628]
MARMPATQRAAEQKVRQKEHRDRARDKRRPSRDDITRLLLWQMITGVSKNRSDQREVLDRLRNELVDGLEKQGFDVRESEDAFEELVTKYVKGPKPIRPKRHLQKNAGGSGAG